MSSAIDEIVDVLVRLGLVKSNGSGGLARNSDPATRVVAVRLTAPETLPATTDKTIPWDTCFIGDPTGVWSAGDPTKLVIPPGYTKARFTFSLEFAPSFDVLNPVVFAMTHLNGAAFNGNSAVSTQLVSEEVMQLNAVTALVNVSEGNVYTVMCNHRAAAAQSTVVGDYKICWFQVELTN